MRRSLIARLKDSSYGIIDQNGMFRTNYMYYYFLGRFLANNRDVGNPVIEAMCEESYLEANYLTLLFTIHHTSDNSIIDDILLRTMVTLSSVSPATMHPEETKRFTNVLSHLPENILSTDSVAHVRQDQRSRQDAFDQDQSVSKESDGHIVSDGPENEVYRILRNNKVMGQILRNKYGNLERLKIKEIIEVIADSGLRLVNAVLGSEEATADIAYFIRTRYPEWSNEEIRQGVEFLSFIWAMSNIELTVSAINVPNIRQAVDEVVAEKSTPAYDLVGYFAQLDRAESLTKAEHTTLAGLLKRHKDIFIKRVLSIRTQYYMNTHHSKAMTEQAVCSLLGIQYRRRLTQ